MEFSVYMRVLRFFAASAQVSTMQTFHAGRSMDPDGDGAGDADFDPMIEGSSCRGYRGHGG